MSDGGQESVNDEEEDDYSDEQSNPDSLVITEEENADGENAGGDFKNARGKSKPYKKNSERITSSFLTKYERARVLGTRAL